MMEIKSLQELQAADGLTLAFGPLGLGGQMRPEHSLEFQQLQIADCDLVEGVADSTRAAFERLRRVYAYGVLSYDIFTVVSDAAQLVRERALRDRFMQWSNGSVTFERVSGAGQSMTESISSYDDVFTAAKGAMRRSKSGQKWLLKVNQELIDFNGMLKGLLRWARAAELLRGQRARRIETVQTYLRNFVAHGTYGVDTPVDAARSLRDLAEFINQLWGSPTPGGRLYPAPVPRVVAALAWNDSIRVVMGIDGLRGWDDDEAHASTFILVRAVARFGTRLQDPHLLEFDNRFETTNYPADYLWGPGPRSKALTWLDENQPAGDVVDYLDRILLVREHNGIVYSPMRPEVAAGIGDSQRPGRWHAVRADFPYDAFAHARAAAAEPDEHGEPGADCPADGCAVHVLARGSYQEALAAAGQHGPVNSLRPPDIMIPSPLRGPNRF